MNTPILAYPDVKEPFILDTNTSAFGVSGVLSQIQNGEENVIVYGSKILSKSQSKYLYNIS